MYLDITGNIIFFSKISKISNQSKQYSN